MKFFEVFLFELKICDHTNPNEKEALTLPITFLTLGTHDI